MSKVNFNTNVPMYQCNDWCTNAWRVVFSLNVHGVIGCMWMSEVKLYLAPCTLYLGAWSYLEGPAFSTRLSWRVFLLNSSRCLMQKVVLHGGNSYEWHNRGGRTIHQVIRSTVGEVKSSYTLYLVPRTLCRQLLHSPRAPVETARPHAHV